MACSSSCIKSSKWLLCPTAARLHGRCSILEIAMYNSEENSGPPCIDWKTARTWSPGHVTEKLFWSYAELATCWINAAYPKCFLKGERVWTRTPNPSECTTLKGLTRISQLGYPRCGKHLVPGALDCTFSQPPDCLSSAASPRCQ